MNKVYIVSYKKHSDTSNIRVLAKNLGDAFIKAERWLKRNTYVTCEILEIQFECKIDVIYKS